MTNGDEPMVPMYDVQGRISSNVDMNHLHGMGAMMGLTKREYFAANALQGFCSAGSTGMPTAENLAIYAINAADALINALNKEREEKS